MQHPTSSDNNINTYIEERIEAENIRSKSFIVTVFGDVISQHGNSVWLGSLIDSLKPLGISERLIRTSVFRLVKDDWLQVEKIGRKSFYSYTETAHQHYTKAARRIYAGDSQYSSDNWLIVIPSFVSKNKLMLLKRQLQWLGFSSLSSGAYAHPSIDEASVEEMIKEYELEGSVIIFSSKIYDEGSETALKKLVHQKWHLDQLQMNYQSLIDDYKPVLNTLESNYNLTDQQSYLLRNLLIHRYRRILLNDYELPQNILPPDWTGFVANSLVKQLYKLIAKPSCRFIINNMQNSRGNLPKANPSFNKRFK